MTKVCTKIIIFFLFSRIKLLRAGLCQKNILKKKNCHLRRFFVTAQLRFHTWRKRRRSQVSPFQCHRRVGRGRLSRHLNVRIMSRFNQILIIGLVVLNCTVIVGGTELPSDYSQELEIKNKPSNFDESMY